MALIKCPGCGQEMSDIMAHACPKCGRLVEKSSPPSTSNPLLIVCFECKKPLPDQATRCPNCGAPVMGAAPIQPPPVSPAGARMPPNAGAAEQMKSCAECGRAVPISAAACPFCGFNSAPASFVLPAPEVGDSYGYAWKMLWLNIGPLLLVALVNFLLGIPGYIHSIPWEIRWVYMVLVGMPLGYGFYFVYLKCARAEKVEVVDLFRGFKSYGNVLAAAILSGLIIVGGLILLIVPGIIFACKLAFVPYLVTDGNMGAVDAISKSWNMTKGYTGTVFLMVLMAIPIIIGGLICLVIGIIPAMLWIGLANASLYLAVSAKKS